VGEPVGAPSGLLYSVVVYFLKKEKVESKKIKKNFETPRRCRLAWFAILKTLRRKAMGSSRLIMAT
jgi:hypothetical protein